MLRDKRTSQWSSLGASIAAYQPYYAPPVTPQTNFIRTGGAAFVTQPPAVLNNTQGAAIVRRVFRTYGIRFLYQYGGQIKDWFSMRATGQVESTKFQPVLAYTWDGCFNDGLFRAGGYPQNLGLSEKVPSIPEQALGVTPTQMLPRPQIKRSIFVNRVFSTIKGEPAESTYPTQGAYS